MQVPTSARARVVVIVERLRLTPVTLLPETVIPLGAVVDFATEMLNTQRDFALEVAKLFAIKA